MEVMTVRSFRDLLVWQKAMALVVEIYKLTGKFPAEELQALADQIRRSAVSIPSNIAEGYGRNSSLDYLRFLSIAVGSLFEVQTQLQISHNLGYIGPSDFDRLSADAAEIGRLLQGLIASLKGRNARKECVEGSR